MMGSTWKDSWERMAGVAVVAVLLAMGAAPQGDSTSRFVGKAAPDFELQVLGGKGKTLKLSDLKGKAVVINFWATWCEPCKVEMPWLVDLQKQYGPQGLQIIGVAMDDTDEKDIAAFAKKMAVNYPILLGTEKVADLYGGLDGLPALFFVDRSGKIVEQELGLRSESVIVDNIRKSLAQAKEPNKTVSNQ